MMSAESTATWTLLAFQAGGVQQLVSMIPIVAIVGIFYVLVWLPMRKKQKDFQALVENLKKGDRVVTTGGIYGEVVSVDTATVILKIADTVKVKVAKAAISALEGEGDKGDKQ